MKKIRKLLQSNTIFQNFFILSFVTLIVFGIIISPVYERLNYLTYDLFFSSLKKPVTQSDDLVLIDIDDNAMNRDIVPFSWPWPRYIFGDAVEILADFNAKVVVFDIEFLGKSVAGVNMDHAKNLDSLIDTISNETINVFDQYINMIKANTSLLSDITNINTAFKSYINQNRKNLSKSVEHIFIDNDDYFYKRLNYYGRAYGTVNMINNNEIIEEENNHEIENNDQYLKKFGIHTSEFSIYTPGAIPSMDIAEFPNATILTGFKDVGFTKIERDIDGATRNISLFLEKDGYIFPQLSLSPFLDIYEIKPEQIEIYKNKIIFNDINLRNKYQKLSIPLYKKSMIINWPSEKEFSDIFTTYAPDNNTENSSHFSISHILYYKYTLLPALDDAVNDLKMIDDDQISDYITEYNTFKQAKLQLTESMHLSDTLRDNVNLQWNQVKNNLKSISTKEKITERLTEINDVITMIENGENLGISIEQLMEIRKNVNAIFTNLQNAIKNIDITENILNENINNKICFIGLTATGTTDIGATPLDKSFENVGTHPSVYNTILQKDFIYIINDYLIFIFTFFVFLIFLLLLKTDRPSILALIGSMTMIIIIFTISLIFRFSGYYISPVTPFIYGIAVFMMLIFLKLFISEKDKAIIRNTFNRYLSPVVINELLKDPDMIEFGGEKRRCSALFSDIQGFSTISEQFMDDPRQLVSFLNEYLSVMSDIILDLEGVIDKYEGDAIIAFFGAPHDSKDHALKACLSSIRMKKAEISLNEKMMKQNILKTPLITRIGINTGNMVVGNMGSSKRLDYTMIGHSVNLAARLEGVNKQYNTFQLISEFTHADIKDHIITRKLDKVRVVNINTPIRLYELIDEQEEVTPEQFEMLNIFHRGLKEFETKKWKEAMTIFKEIEKIDPTSSIYIERCKTYIKKNPPESWDGVYNLTSK